MSNVLLSPLDRLSLALVPVDASAPMGSYALRISGLASTVESGANGNVALTVKATDSANQTADLIQVRDNVGTNLLFVGPPVQPAPPGPSDNFFGVYGQGAVETTTNVDAYLAHFRYFLPDGAGSGAGYKAVRAHLPQANTQPYGSATYTGVGGLAAVEGEIDQAGGGVNPISGSTGNWFAGNVAGAFLSTGQTSVGWNVGAMGQAGASNKQNWGLLGYARSTLANAANVGVLGTARPKTGAPAGQKNIGVAAILQNTEPTQANWTNTALVADNQGTPTANIADFFANNSLMARVDGSGHLAVEAGTATTAGGALALKIGSGPGPGVYFGSGAPTISAPKGSLYLRSDGSSTSTRMYVNTDGATTWTNVTTAA